MSIESNAEENICSKTTEISVRRWVSSFLKRMKKKKSPSQEVNSEEHEAPEDSHVMRRKKPKNLQLFLSEMMRKLKQSIKKVKPQRDEKKRSFKKSLSTKDHFFLERMPSMSQKRSHHQHNYDKENNHVLNFGDFDQEFATRLRRIASVPGYSSPCRSPRRIRGHNSAVHSRSASDYFINNSESLAADDTIEVLLVSEEGSIIPLISESNQSFDEISKLCDILKETSNEDGLPSLSSIYNEEYKSIIEPVVSEYEIIAATGEVSIQPLHVILRDEDCYIDEKELVFKYVKAVLDAVGSNCWDELYLKTEFSGQLLNPALISNIPFCSDQLCVDREQLLFDCVNEVLLEYCRFPPWVSFAKPRYEVSLFSVESIGRKVQEQVYSRLFPLQVPQSVDEIVKEDMDKPRNWLDIRSDLECIGFETSEMILNELLEEVMLDL